MGGIAVGSWPEPGTPGIEGARPPTDGSDVAGMCRAAGGGGVAGFLSQSLRRGGPRVPDGVGVVARSSNQAELAGAAGFRLLHIARWRGGSGSGSVTLCSPRHILQRHMANDHSAVSSVGAADHGGLDVILPRASGDRSCRGRFAQPASTPDCHWPRSSIKFPTGRTSR